jgi:hypothetical protein
VTKAALPDGGTQQADKDLDLATPSDAFHTPVKDWR